MDYLTSLCRKHVVHIYNSNGEAIVGSYAEIMDTIHDFDYAETMSSEKEYYEFMSFLEQYEYITNMYIDGRLEKLYYVTYTSNLLLNVYAARKVSAWGNFIHYGVT